MGQSTFSRRNDLPATMERELVWSRSPAGRFTGPATGGKRITGLASKSHDILHAAHARTHVMPCQVLSSDREIVSSWVERNSGRPVRSYVESTALFGRDVRRSPRSVCDVVSEYVYNAP